MFRDNTVSPSSRVDVRSLKMKPLRYLKTSETAWLPRDVELYPREKESSATELQNSWNSDKWQVSCVKEYSQNFLYLIALSYNPVPSHEESPHFSAEDVNSWLCKFILHSQRHGFTITRGWNGRCLWSLLQMFKEVSIVQMLLECFNLSRRIRSGIS